MNFVIADVSSEEFIGLVVLAASFIVAVGVVWRAIVAIWRAIHRLESRIKKLHELSTPDEPHGGTP